jgi:hypothetical protein
MRREMLVEDYGIERHAATRKWSRLTRRYAAGTAQLLALSVRFRLTA